MTTQGRSDLARAPGHAGQTPLYARQQNARLVLGSGAVIGGFAIGATGRVVGELCFNTAMTGYQEVLTDPSYAGQIITFTFPHIGNTGANDDDIEMLDMGCGAHALGLVLRADISAPSNWRQTLGLDAWLKKRGIVGICGVDTRALTAHIREHGMPNAVICNDPDMLHDSEALRAEAREWRGLKGMDLVPGATCAASSVWREGAWDIGKGYAPSGNENAHVAVIDYGIKRNILRQLIRAGASVTVVPSTTSAEEIITMKPDGVFLSNGPGDPAETGKYAVPVIQKILAHKIPLFGICLGHQLLGLAVGGQTSKMPQGHHGANHPVKDVTTGRVEITSMNHGFAVERASLPAHARETHVSLFDGTNSGLELTNGPAFSVQHHPEASPGPEDSHYLFDRFMTMMLQHKQSVNHDAA